MMNNNKILTVSYGTFSCTLEGFEDSFGTMKAIAEYFRDLAADDRYFGAEPPQPDAEMLARIAQREVSRRVEAREQDGKIVLSAVEETPAQEPAATAAPAAAALVATADVAAAPIATDVPAAVAMAEEQTEPTQVERTITAEDEAEVAEVEAALTDTLSTEELTDDVLTKDYVDEPSIIADISVEDEDIATQNLDVVAQELAEDEVFVEDENDIVPGQPDAEVEAFFAGSAPAPEETAIEEPLADTAEVAAPVGAEELSHAAAPAPDSIAAKLQRIRAVVAQHEEVEDDGDYLEDEHAEETADTDAAVPVAEARADIEDALDADDAIEADMAEDDNDDVAAILSRIESTPVDTVAEAMEDSEGEDAETDDDISAAVAAADRYEDTVNNLFEEDEGTLEIAENIPAPAEVEEAPAKPELRKPAHPRARVIKVKRADLEAAIHKGDLEEYDEDGDAAAQDERVEAKAEKQPALDDLAPAKSGETSLSPEDEADLARELAELEADIMAEAKPEDGDIEEATEAGHEPEHADEDEGDALAAAAARAKLPSIDDEDSSDVNRLLAETDHQMDEPEGATRRDAFAHLRAAVAAKKADSTIEDVAEKGAGAYRADLAEVVRPRRPVSSEARTERPDDARPAPLKLVAEQRIDVERPKAAGPVRPRRVAAVVDNGPEESADSFADFAAEMGASSLPQLLEAAAAYLSFVEGRKQFSRPQLMTKVRQAGGDEGFSREEGLRSFGQLLRAGKIEKIKGGRFTASEDIGFRPDQRAAG